MDVRTNNVKRFGFLVLIGADLRRMKMDFYWIRCWPTRKKIKGHFLPYSIEPQRSKSSIYRGKQLGRFRVQYSRENILTLCVTKFSGKLNINTKSPFRE